MQEIVLVIEHTALCTPSGEKDTNAAHLLSDYKEQGIPVWVYNGYAMEGMERESVIEALYSTSNHQEGYRTESCECNSCLCIRNALLSRISEIAIVIAIADTDGGTCCTRFADIVFARGKAARFCNQQKIPHFPFATLFDVRQISRKHIFSRHLRPRHQARLQRKEAFETE